MKNTYFVVEPEQIVAQDLAHAIRACDPLAEISLFRSVDEVVAPLSHIRPAVVILNAEPRRLLSSPVGQALKDARVPLAFLGAMDEARPEGAEVLASPFSEATVAALLRRLTDHSKASQC